MDHADLVAQLEARWPENRIGPGLGREEALLDLLGNPQRSCPVIHIAGTNGKGSTQAMIRAGLEAAGLRVNAYTSPHLARFNERIRLPDGDISDADLAAALAEVERRARAAAARNADRRIGLDDGRRLGCAIRRQAAERMRCARRIRVL